MGVAEFVISIPNTHARVSPHQDKEMKKQRNHHYADKSASY